MEIIKDKNSVLAKILYESDFSSSNFISEESGSLQVGLFSYDKGMEIVNHIHNRFERKNYDTQELIYIVRGGVELRLFNNSRELVTKKELYAPCMVYLISGGHGFTVLKNDTFFFEAKNGPYFGVEKDKVKFDK